MPYLFFPHLPHLLFSSSNSFLAFLPVSLPFLSFVSFYFLPFPLFLFFSICYFCHPATPFFIFHTIPTLLSPILPQPLLTLHLYYPFPPSFPFLPYSLPFPTHQHPHPYSLSFPFSLHIYPPPPDPQSSSLPFHILPSLPSLTFLTTSYHHPHPYSFSYSYAFSFSPSIPFSLSIPLPFSLLYFSHPLLPVHYEMDRLFCSKCGANHMSRVGASVNAKTGELKLHLKANYVVNTLGEWWSVVSYHMC